MPAVASGLEHLPDRGVQAVASEVRVIEEPSRDSAGTLQFGLGRFGSADGHSGKRREVVRPGEDDERPVRPVVGAEEGEPAGDLAKRALDDLAQRGQLETAGYGTSPVLRLSVRFHPVRTCCPW